MPTRLGITLGDINGIGPEIALKAAHATARSASLQIVLIGAERCVREQAEAYGFPPPPLWDPVRRRPKGPIVVWDPSPQLAPAWTPGRIVADASRAAESWIRLAVLGCRRGWLHGMVTAPICKEGFQKAGFEAPGHTELLAELTHTRRFAMMLFGGPLRVILVTRHLPLAQVPAHITQDAILEAIDLAGHALPWMGLRKARIGVCGLNPHCGDGGKIGDEEKTIIEPALRKARRKGFNVTGPIPADVIFHQAVHGQHDAVVAMYHDQGLGPLKTLAFDSGVNLTLGLPIVRTSPDHGTAFAIAGQGIANPDSMIEAIRWAARLAKRPNPWARPAP